MDTPKLKAEIERQIADWQQVQMANPPDSDVWQEASGEIARLAAMLVPMGRTRKAKARKAAKLYDAGEGRKVTIPEE